MKQEKGEHSVAAPINLSAPHRTLLTFWMGEAMVRGGGVKGTSIHVCLEHRGG